MVLRILPILLATLVLSDLYLYYKFFHRKHRRGWTYTAFLPNILLCLAALVLSFTENHTTDNMQHMALFFSLYMLFILPKTVYLLIDLAGKGVSRLFPRTKKACGIFSCTLSILLFFVMLSGLTFGLSHLKVRKTEFRSDDLPATFDGYRIVQFSDLHLSSFVNSTETVAAIMDKIMEQHPDMIVFTGDLVSIDVDEMNGFDEILSRLKAPDGVYTIMGNHDYLTYAHYLSPKEQAIHRQQLIGRQRAAGWDMLLNEHRIIRRGNDSIALVGVENDGKPPFPERGNLKKALKGIPGYGTNTGSSPRMFKVLLSHDPTHWRRKVLPETDIQLTLSGHTHGMQFMIFGWSPSRWFYPEWKHMYNEGERGLYVSLGVGEALIPFRFGAWPEINVITLHRK